MFTGIPGSDGESLITTVITGITNTHTSCTTVTFTDTHMLITVTMNWSTVMTTLFTDHSLVTHVQLDTIFVLI